MRDALFFGRKAFTDFSTSSEDMPTNFLSGRFKKLVALGLPTHRQHHVKPLQ